MTDTTTMASKLIAEEGLLKDLVLSFEDGEQWVIGRDPDAAQLIVEDPSASRKHALCRRTSQGITIENLSSTNPIIINDEEIAQPRLMQHGDMVRIGNSVFCFYTETEAHLFDENGRDNKKEADKPHDTILREQHEDDHAEIAKVNFDLLDTGRWLLKVISGPNAGAEFSMQTNSSYLIGTDPNSCDIVFYDTSVSRQHARLTISPEDTISIEDLKSRNGTRVDGEIISSHMLTPNTIVTTGTTSFVVYDREGEMQTIISPLLPSIVKVLNKEEAAATNESTEAAENQNAEAAAFADQPETATQEEKPKHTLEAFIVSAILIGLFAIVGVSVQTLFMQEPVQITQQIDTDQVLHNALDPFPSVKYSFNKATGRLLIVGHVNTLTDKNQMLYNLQGLGFIKDIDDTSVIIDEYVWTEANQILSKNPDWKGITVHATSPGHFVLSGYLQSRDTAEQVWEYLTRNFPYLDLLENKIIIEEDILIRVNNDLASSGLGAVTTQITNGELTLSGTIPEGKKEAYSTLVAQFKEIPGVRGIRNLAVEKPRDEAFVNISDRYFISGISQANGNKVNVVINGRILAPGDFLDGMKLTTITPNYVLLEKDQTMYRIDYSR